jgi:Kef-type K+ transport system membrane component KefB
MRTVRYLVTYAGFVVVPVAAVVLIAGHGRSSGVAGPPPIASTPAGPTTLPWLLAALSLIVLATHATGALATRAGQPRVIGEIAGGILLGPSLLGALLPGLSARLFSPGVQSYLKLLAELGVVFFMFLIGNHLSGERLRGKRFAPALLGHAALAGPVLAGVALAAGPIASWRPPGVPEPAFVLFTGLALGVTAFPVLARILVDTGLRDTDTGVLAMAVAAVADITAWCVLGLVVTLAAGGGARGGLRTLLAAAALTAVLVVAVRPLLRWLAGRADDGRSGPVALTIALLLTALGSALVMEAVGAGAIFGGFLAGAVAPRRSAALDEFKFRLEGPTMWLLLPVFFALVGLRIDLGTVLRPDRFGMVALIVVVAMVIKVACTAAPAALIGIEGNTAVLLGVLMSCRGLTEIVVLDLGVSRGLISSDQFAVFVVMALVTTALTGPLMRLVRPAAARPVSSRSRVQV